jgi:hypothetical protein
VEPSWLVSGGLAVLAVMPHQIPLAARQVIRNPVGAILAVTMAAWLSHQSPVLAIALLLLIAGVWTMPFASEPFQSAVSGLYKQASSSAGHEPFVSSTVLNKDIVNRKRRWLGELIMSEEPSVIQERTDAPAILKDEVGHEEAKPWFGESAMGEHPAGIQERPVAWRDYDEDGGR